MARRRSISIDRGGKDVRSFYRNVSEWFLLRVEEAEDKNFILSCIIGSEIEY